MNLPAPGELRCAYSHSRKWLRAIRQCNEAAKSRRVELRSWLGRNEARPNFIRHADFRLTDSDQRLGPLHELKADAPRISQHGEGIARWGGSGGAGDGGPGAGQSFDVGLDVVRDERQMQ